MLRQLFAGLASWTGFMSARGGVGVLLTDILDGQPMSRSTLASINALMLFAASVGTMPGILPEIETRPIAWSDLIQGLGR